MIPLLVLALLLAGGAPALAGGREEAVRHYRLARRLAAEGSPEAAAALRRVVELDPDGPFADDALVDEALLEPLPDWPEELGRIEIISARKALALLEHALDRNRAGDRSAEARYRRALLRLEPLPGHDPSAARVDLAAVALAEPSTEWSSRARYAMAWLHERRGEEERALAAYQRLVVDDPRGEIGLRGRVGVAGLMLRSGEYGAAARWLQEAVEAGVPESTGAIALRELAVRRLLDGAGSSAERESTAIATGVRSATSIAAVPGGGALLSDAKQGRVIELDADGVVVDEWVLGGLQSVTVSLPGRRYAAAGESVYRLEPEGRAVELTSLGEYAPVSAMAVDEIGGVWLLDRRGRGLGRIEPGDPAPRPFWEGDGVRIVAMTWDGRRLVGIDGKQKSLVAFDERAGLEVLLAEVGSKPVAIAADPSGVLAVLDARARQVRFLSPAGAAPGPVSVAELERPLSLSLDAEGGLHLLDGATGSWSVRR